MKGGEGGPARISSATHLFSRAFGTYTLSAPVPPLERRALGHDGARERGKDLWNGSLARFGRAVLGQDLQTRDGHNIDHLIIAAGLVNQHFSSCRRQGNEVLMRHGNAAASPRSGSERGGMAARAKACGFR